MSDTEQQLMLVLRDLLGADANNSRLTTNFSELGLDSITGLRFARKAQDTFGIEIDPEWLLDHPSVAALARMIDAQREAVHSSITR